jgi:predicted nucleic acid-binding protein
MISSSNPPNERGLDAMLIVYSLLEDHPASTTCEQFIRTHSGWFTTALTLLEVKAILTKVYAVDAVLASRKLAQLVAGPMVVIAVDHPIVLAAMHAADVLGIDLTDAVLLHTVQARGALWLATDDTKLAQACRQVGVMPETPIDTALRQQMGVWEAANLPAKGLPRVLRQIHQWLHRISPPMAEDFWSYTGGGSHLP